MAGSTRLTVLFSGTVQGVGFRYSTRQLARGFEVTGYVRNLQDGRVELVAEGERPELDRFVGAVRQEMGGYIRDVQTTPAPGTGEFQDFSIRR